MTKEKIPCPTEAVEQTSLLRWAFYEQGAYPELGLLYHIPNEGKRSARTGAAMKMQGMKPGFPDLGLPVARGQYHGLYVEMKRREGETPTQQQYEWLKALDAQGYAVCWAKGWEEAAQAILHYLKTGTVHYSVLKCRAGEYHAAEAVNFG